jgi:hypothetical protein
MSFVTAETKRRALEPDRPTLCRASSGHKSYPSKNLSVQVGGLLAFIIIPLDGTLGSHRTLSLSFVLLPDLLLNLSCSTLGRIFFYSSLFIPVCSSASYTPTPLHLAASQLYSSKL